MADWSSDSQATQTSSLPPWLQPYAEQYLGQSANLASQQQPQYGGQRVAPLNDAFYQANDLITQRALNGAPDLNAARGSAMNIAGGAYQNNPWLGSEYTDAVIGDTAGNMADAFSRGTAATNAANFARQGAFGGSAYQQKQALDAAELAKQVGQMGNQYRLQNQQMGVGDYRSGVNQMLQGGQLAGNLAQDDWTAAQMLGGAGDAQRAYQNELLSSAYGTWQQQQQYPYEQLNFFGNALANASGGQGQTTMTQPGESPWGNILGGLLVGGSLWDSFNRG